MAKARFGNYHSRKLENLMFEVMTVVTEQGFREVGDTAVREAIWAELKKA